MEEQKKNPAQGLSESEQVQVRRQKLADLQAAGHDPFTLTKYPLFCININVKPGLLSLQVKAVEFLPGRKMQAYRRLWIKDSQVTALFLYVAITLCLVGLGGHLYSRLLAMIENIIDKLCIHRSSASVHSFRPE